MLSKLESACRSLEVPGHDLVSAHCDGPGTGESTVGSKADDADFELLAASCHLERSTGLSLALSWGTYRACDPVPDILQAPVKIGLVTSMVTLAHRHADIYNVDGSLLVGHDSLAYGESPDHPSSHIEAGDEQLSSRYPSCSPPTVPIRIRDF